MPFYLNFAFHECEIDGKGEVFCSFLQFSLLICDIAASFASLHSVLVRQNPGPFELTNSIWPRLRRPKQLNIELYLVAWDVSPGRRLPCEMAGDAPWKIWI